MNAEFFDTAVPVYRAGPKFLQALNGDDGLELPLERLANGQLTNSCRDRESPSADFLKKHSAWPRRVRSARLARGGVSLRRLTLPAASKEELQRLLLLQIENNFRFRRTNWRGYFQPGWENRPRNGAAPGHELIVVAVKKRRSKILES